MTSKTVILEKKVVGLGLQLAHSGLKRWYVCFITLHACFSSKFIQSRLLSILLQLVIPAPHSTGIIVFRLAVIVFAGIGIALEVCMYALFVGILEVNFIENLIGRRVMADTPLHNLNYYGDTPFKFDAPIQGLGSLEPSKQLVSDGWRYGTVLVRVQSAWIWTVTRTRTWLSNSSNPRIAGYNSLSQPFVPRTVYCLSLLCAH
eukprot:scaffold128463_cov46-Prasinocladus_malaysianus.AAC.1